jgi:bifunctional DNase/RNase
MEENIPKKKIKKIEIISKSADELTEFDLIPITLEKMLVTLNNDSLILLSTNNKKILLPINNMEATMLTFIYSDCADESHINTIYHLHISTLEHLGIKIDSAVIEAKDGDIWYGRLCMINKKGKKFYCQCSAGDAVIFATFTKTPLTIVRKVLDSVDAFGEDNEEELFYDENDE